MASKNYTARPKGGGLLALWMGAPPRRASAPGLCIFCLP